MRRGVVPDRSSPGRFATIIQARLRDLRWSEGDLATAARLSPGRVHGLLQQRNLSERLFLRLCDVLGLDFDVIQIGRPLAPLTGYERYMAWLSVDACRAAGGIAEAEELARLIDRKPGDVERDAFNRAMQAVQRVITRAKVRNAGFDPDEILGDED